MRIVTHKLVHTISFFSCQNILDIAVERLRVHDNRILKKYISLGFWDPVSPAVIIQTHKLLSGPFHNLHPLTAVVLTSSRLSWIYAAPLSPLLCCENLQKSYTTCDLITLLTMPNENKSTLRRRTILKQCT